MMNAGTRVLILSGSNTLDVQFVDIAQWMRFRSDMNEVKSMLASINDDLRSGHIRVLSPENFSRHMAWLGICHKHRRNWGDQMVCEDIRQAWQSIELFMGVPVTEFDGPDAQPGTETNFHINDPDV